MGVTGHRPGGLNAADMDMLQNRIREVLAAIKNMAGDIHNSNVSLYGGPAPILRIISPLAEGSDRIAARQAMDLGYELQCPLPFERNEYKKDFAAAESQKEFTDLLRQATAVFELDGSRAASGDSYRAVGQIVLNQCDILLAVWDGNDSKGRGGTGQIVQLAALQVIPVVWINSQKPHSISLLGFGSEKSEGDWDLRVREKLVRLLIPPGPQPGHDKSAAKDGVQRQIGDYFRETQRTFNAGVFYKLFQDMLPIVLLFFLQFPVPSFLRRLH